MQLYKKEKKYVQFTTGHKFLQQAKNYRVIHYTLKEIIISYYSYYTHKLILCF